MEAFGAGRNEATLSEGRRINAETCTSGLSTARICGNRDIRTLPWELEWFRVIQNKVNNKGQASRADRRA